MTDDTPNVLDGDRSGDNEHLMRVVLSEHAILDVRIPEVDQWAKLPLRITHDAVFGPVLEIGPYSLDRDEVGKLSDAVDAYLLTGLS